MGDEVFRNPAYYIIVQASKFVPPGSVCIAWTMTDLPNVAFKTPEGEVATILLNKDKVDKTIEVKMDEKAVFIVLPRKSVGTLVYEDN